MPQAINVTAKIVRYTGSGSTAVDIAAFRYNAARIVDIEGDESISDVAFAFGLECLAHERKLAEPGVGCYVAEAREAVSTSRELEA